MFYSSPPNTGYLWPSVAQELQYWGDDLITDEELEAWYLDTHITDEDEEQ